MTANLTLAIQVVILLMIGAINWRLVQNHRAMLKSASMIAEYRREIGWLTARLDAIETVVKRNGK